MATTANSFQALLARLTFLIALWATPALSGECRAGVVEIRGDWGQLAFNIQVADTPQERAAGLMHVETMRKLSGMLFIYEAPQFASFWMKNTLIELDMLFADKTGRIRHIHHRAIPGDLSPINGGDNILTVLEINGGLAKRFGINVGSELRHSAFAMGPASWPC